MIFKILFLVLVAVVTMDTIWIFEHSDNINNLEDYILELKKGGSKDASNVQ